MLFHPPISTRSLTIPSTASSDSETASLRRSTECTSLGTWATNLTDSPNFDRAIFQTLPRPARRTFRASNLSPPDFAPRNTYRTPAVTPTKLSTASNSPDTPPRPTPRLAASLYTWAKASRSLAGTASTRASPAMKSNSRIDCTWTIRRVKSNAEVPRSSLYFQSINHKRKEKLFCCQHEKQY